MFTPEHPVRGAAPFATLLYGEEVAAASRRFASVQRARLNIRHFARVQHERPIAAVQQARIVAEHGRTRDRAAPLLPSAPVPRQLRGLPGVLGQHRVAPVAGDVAPDVGEDLLVRAAELGGARRVAALFALLVQ